MNPVLAVVPTPNAARLHARHHTQRYEEVRALVNIIQRSTGLELAQLAALLDIGHSTLEGYMRPPRKGRGRTQKGVPYTVIYCLEVMASCPGGVKDAANVAR